MPHRPLESSVTSANAAAGTAGQTGSLGWLTWLALLAGLLGLFYPGLIFSRVPAFRDAYHFYYPQAVWLDACVQQGDYFPRWNAAEGLGVSVTGQPSAALYYPLRVLWLLPGLSVAQRFSLVIVVHLLIAAKGMRFAARKLQLSDEASWLAAISYCLSCPILFQHTNLIYLCSAAWIGFALAAIIECWQSPHHTLSHSLTLAAAGSMMFLAGDPQATVNTWLIGGLVVGGDLLLGIWRRRSTVPDCKSKISLPTFITAAQPLLRLLLAGILMVGITAVQWIPAWHWSQYSARVSAQVAPAYTSMVALDTILSQASSTPHRVYDFSLSPWHLATLLWPTLGGAYLPTNSRLFAAIPAEGRMWIPALYFGCLPCLLVLGSLRKPWTWKSSTLLSIAAFALLASLGNYSFVWLLREVLNGIGLPQLSQQLPRDHVTSLNWLLCEIVPGYEMFRYPAKWTVWFVAAGCLLAGSQLKPEDGWQISRRLIAGVRLLSIVGFLSALTCWLAAISGDGCDRWLAQNAPDIWLGPPQAAAIAWSLAFASLLPLGVLAWNQSSLPLYAITLVEMTLCAGCWVSFLPPPSIGGRLPTANATRAPIESFVWADCSEANIQADRWSVSPASFASDQADYQEVFLLGKLGALANVKCLSATQSLEPAAWSRLRAWLSKQDRMTRQQPQLDAILRELGVTHRLVRVRRSDQPAQFFWHAISASQPLCHVVADPSLRDVGRTLAAANSLSWKWLDSSQLDIRVAPAQSGILRVLQTNDGGWIARDGRGQRRTISASTLWIEIPLSATDTEIRLTRKWLW